MFTIRANHSETVEIEAEFDEVHDFFSDISNFIDLMPNVESIHEDGKGKIHWKIRAEVPFIGSFTEKFIVRQTENSDERIEWSPVEGEKSNLMKYSSDLIPKKKNLTLVQFSQSIEMRRNSAMDLHLLAGFAGENLINSEMSRRIAEMLEIFVIEAKDRIERK
jgi:uncharacterized membrane protein